MRLIQARFKSKCAETGAVIPKGVNCWHDKANHKVYSMESNQAATEQQSSNQGQYLDELDNGLDFCPSDNT